MRYESRSEVEPWRLKESKPGVVSFFNRLEISMLSGCDRFNNRASVKYWREREREGGGGEREREREREALLNTELIACHRSYWLISYFFWFRGN